MSSSRSVRAIEPEKKKMKKVAQNLLFSQASSSNGSHRSNRFRVSIRTGIPLGSVPVFYQSSSASGVCPVSQHAMGQLQRASPFLLPWSKSSIYPLNHSWIKPKVKPTNQRQQARWMLYWAVGRLR